MGRERARERITFALGHFEAFVGFEAAPDSPGFAVHQSDAETDGLGRAFGAHRSALPGFAGGWLDPVQVEATAAGRLHPPVHRQFAYFSRQFGQQVGRGGRYRLFIGWLGFRVGHRLPHVSCWLMSIGNAGTVAGDEGSAGPGHGGQQETPSYSAPMMDQLLLPCGICCLPGTAQK